MTFMGYQKAESDGVLTRFRVEGGNAADTIDIETRPGASAAGQGAGSVHHIAFAVEDRAAQLGGAQGTDGHGVPSHSRD